MEDKGDDGIGRIRLCHLEDAYSKSLIPFVQSVVQSDTTIRKDNWRGYRSLNSKGFAHVIHPSKDLKLVHLVASLLKRWIPGTYQGSV